MKKLQEQDDKLTNIGETLSNASNEIVKKLKQEKMKSGKINMNI